MENISNNNNKYIPKFTLEELKILPKMKIKENLKTESNNTSNKRKSSFPNDSLIINSLSLKSIKNKNNSAKKEKPYKKAILHSCINSYFKETFGSIPNKTEKFLLINNNKDRFSGSNSVFRQIAENTPGVGSYNLSYDWNLKNKAVKMGESEEKRFPSSYNFLPGVGDYHIENGIKIQNERDNLRYNSLYKRTKTLLNNELNKNIDNFLSYSPQNLDEIMRNKKKYNFCSYSGRNHFRGSKIQTLFDKVNDYPGPGQYFSDVNKSAKKSSYYNIRNNTVLENEKPKNILQLIDEHLDDKKDNLDEPKFFMKQNGNIRDNKLYTFEDIYKLNKSNKKIVVNKGEELEKKLRENEKNTASKNLYYNIRQNMELNRIKKILGNDNGRPDLFYLSPERWKNKKKEFRPPGPAYYYY